MTLALAEWAVTVRALAEGEQFVALLPVDAGLGDDRPHRVGSRFFLYPVFHHREAALVRESHVPEIKRALEDGVWSAPAPTARMLEAGLTIAEPTSVRLRAWAEVAGCFAITHPDDLSALSPYHVWTADYAAQRYDWRPERPLRALLLRTHRIPRPVTVRTADLPRAGSPWAEITRELSFEGTAVVSDDEFTVIEREISRRLNTADVAV